MRIQWRKTANATAPTADAKPTIATLEPENGKVQGGGFRPPAEWTPLSSAELDVLQKVRDWLDNGGDVADLYVGKVSVDSPVALWRQQGWVRSAPIPPTWTAYLGGKAEGGTDPV